VNYFRKIMIVVVGLLGPLVIATSANAAIVSFASRAAFDTAFPGSVRENWDGFAVGTTFADGTGANGITYNSSAGDALVTDSFVPSTAPNSLGDTAAGFFEGGDSITFTFSHALTAFGIDINTFGTTAGDYTATTNLGGVAGSVFDPFPGFGTGAFIGFSSDQAFTSITIASPAGIAYSLDTLRAVDATTAAVPEPATLALLALGLSGLGFGRRKGVR
jgi:hypothetical protein